MKWIAKSPEEEYTLINYNNLPIYVNNNDNSKKTQQQACLFCDYYGYSEKIKSARAVYFVRGNRRHCKYSEVLIGILEADALPVDLYEIVHCIKFWNEEGRICFKYPQNKKLKLSYRNFILRCIACDCNTYVKPCKDKFLTGRSGDHVWVSDRQTGKRIMIIHFNDLLINHL